MSNPNQICAITGTSGYVGGRMKAHLQRAGWQVADWTRSGKPGPSTVKFQLGQDVDARALANVRALVHCAYDFRARSWEEILATNVRGSERLLRAARAAGVDQIVVLSSISAFEGCRSLYGQAKLEIESIALSLGAMVIRPGLVYGDTPGGVFGGLVKQVKGSRFIPLLGDGGQVQYLVHDEDLGRLVARCVDGKSAAAQPLTLAHEKGWPLRILVERLAAVADKPVTFLPIPWRLAWLGLKSLEMAGFPAPFRSDSLIGLIHQNPAPSFELARSWQADCRPFEVTPQMLA